MSLLALSALVLAPLPQGITEVEPNDLCPQATLVAPTSGVSLQGNLRSADIDHWLVTLPIGSSSNVWYLWLDEVPGTNVRVSLATGCATIPFTVAGESTAMTLYENPVGGPYVLRIAGDLVPVAGVAYTLRLSSDPCEVFTGDRFEPNSTFATATPLVEFASGEPIVVSGLVTGAGEVDVFLLHLPTAATGWFLTDVEFDAAVDIEVFDAATGGPVPTTATPGATVILSRWLARDLFVRVTGSPLSNCGPYTLHAQAILDPCGRATDDALEGPDVFGTAAPTALGTYPSLSVHEADPDAYAVMVNAGEAVVVSLTVTGPVAASLVLRTQATAGSATTVEQPASTGNRVRRLLVNSGPTPVVWQLGVTTFDGCAGYELALEAFGPGPVGVSYCPGFESSGGVPAVLEAWPTPLATTGELALRATGLPMTIGQFGGLGTLLFGDAMPAQPGATPGHCVGGRTTRVPWTLEATPSTLGAVEVIIDLAATPLAPSIWVGQTFTAQLWYRGIFPSSVFGVTDAARFVVN